MGPFRITRPSAGVRTEVGGGNEEFRAYLDRLLKMIPAEVVGLYLIGAGFIPVDQPTVLSVWAIVCLFGVVAVRAYGTADPTSGKPPQWGPVVISSVAFVIWLYTLGGPFAASHLYVPYVGSLLVLAWTFFVPILYRGPAA